MDEEKNLSYLVGVIDGEALVCSLRAGSRCFGLPVTGVPVMVFIHRTSTPARLDWYQVSGIVHIICRCELGAFVLGGWKGGSVFARFLFRGAVHFLKPRGGTDVNPSGTAVSLW